jgi:hypothetical protein
MARWGCWTASEWKDQAHPNSESAQFRWTIILLMSSGKAKRFGPAARDGKLLLHKGADRFIELPSQDFDPTQISPARDTRLRWMQSVIQCTHYVAGAGEREYLNEADAPGITFVPRTDISESDKAILKIDGAETVENWHYLFPTDRRKRHSRDIVGDGARGA